MKRYNQTHKNIKLLKKYVEIWKETYVQRATRIIKGFVRTHILFNIENLELNHLEEQRKELQKQQMIELQKFKQKKADIIKLNNRKKEIELMKSIEDEKNKLRKIHAKQQELNEIYKTAIAKDISTNIQSGGLSMKNLIPKTVF